MCDRITVSIRYTFASSFAPIPGPFTWKLSQIFPISVLTILKLPKAVISDNGSTYLSAAQELTSLLTSQELKEALGRQGVLWKFIPKYSPWYGGFWERLVGLTKMSLKKVLGRAHISLPMLQTLIVEIEATLNDRPLTHVSCDITDTEPITPAHLLYGRRISSLPYRRVEEDEVVDPTFGEDTNIER